ncbi:MAG: Rab family GTPase [Ekhidna sp.]
MEIVKKIVLVGHFGVGKSSLVKRFVHQKFSDQYLTTIGVKIDKKVVDVSGSQVKLMLWDIAGESTAMKIPKKYFAGAHGILYVFDVSREETYANIQSDLFEISKELNEVPAVVLGNKCDLVEEEFLTQLKGELSLDFKPTSAKTGDFVEESFLYLAQEII